MKRSPLLRRTPLKAKSKLISHSKLERGKPLRRTRLRAKAPKKRTAEQGGDEAYLRFIRSLPCVVYGTPPPSHAHHEVGGGRGKGQKAPDRRTIPLSPRAHDEFHAGRGFCKGWSRQKRIDWQDQEIYRLQKLHSTWCEFGTLEEPERKVV